MNNRWKKLDTIFIILLLGIFLLFSVGFTIMVAKNYKSLSNNMENNYNNNTALFYVAEKIKANDRIDSIFIKDIENVEALVIENKESQKIEIKNLRTDKLIYKERILVHSLIRKDEAEK